MFKRNTRRADRAAKQYASNVLALVIASILLGGFGLPDRALAQDSQSANASDEALEEIVVTSARRRLETLQEVPLSITVVSGEDLERIGAADIIAIGQMSPNVTLEVSRGTNTTLTAFIRGVGQQDPVAGFESGVGLYVDDVYFNRPHAAVLDLYDVDRIEVLRGPQGTLYGRNTIGGAIKYVTRPLSDEAEAKVRLSVGTYNQLDGVLTASAPLSENFRFGGTIAKFTRDGFGNNLNLGTEQYDKDIFGARLTFEWNATDSLFFRLSGDRTQDDSSPKAGHRLLVGAVSGAPILSDVFDSRAGLSVPVQSVDAKGVSLLTEWTLNDSFTLKNIFADRDDETWSPIDFDALPVDDLDVPVVYTNEQTSDELQLLYSGDRLNGIVGAYWLEANAFNEFDVVLNPLGVLIGLPGGLNANTLGDVDTDTWSIFADFTYDINDTFALSIGGRYTSDERSSRVLRRSFTGGFSPTFGGSAVVFATTSDFNGSAKDTEFSPRVSISWQPNDEHHLYFSYSEGFKGGSFDPRGQTSAAPDLDNDGTVSAEEIFAFMRFEPETVKSYEFGWKAAALDNRVMTSLAIFYGDYTDVQVPGSVGVDTDGDGINDTFTGVTTNAGKAELPGLEFEGAFRANDNWSFGLAVGYLDAKYKEFIDATGTNVASQARIQNTPDWTASGSATFEMPMSLFGASGNFAAITSLSYRGDTTQFEFPIPLLDQESFTLWDLSLVWEDDDGKWRAGLHGKNLTDQEYKVAGYDFPALGLEGNVTAFYGNPMTVTATVEYRF